MNKKIINSISVILILLALLFNAIQINFKVNFTESGVFTIIGSELIGIVVSIFLVYIIFKYSNKSDDVKKLIVLCIIYFSYCFIDYFIRIKTIGFEMKSILLFKADFFACVFLLLLLIMKPSIKIYYSIYTVFFSCISSYLSLDWSELTTKYWQCSAIRLTLLFLHYPVLIVYRINSKTIKEKKFMDIICGINIFAILFCYFNLLGRVNTLLVFFIISISELIIIFTVKNWRPWRLLIPMLCVIVSLIIIYPTSYGLLTRLSVLEIKNTLGYSNSTIEVNNTNVPNKSAGDSIKDVETRFEYYQQNESADSSNARFTAWKMALKDIMKNPVFGVGLKQYQVSYSTGNSVLILPHNFILEYIQASGIVGLILFGGIFVCIVLEIIFSKKWLIFGILLLEFAASFGTALFQPIFCDASILITLFINIGIIMNLRNNKEEQSVLKND